MEQTMEGQTVSRYHASLVALHWLLAALILFSLGMGFFVLEGLPNSSPDKVSALRGHTIFGVAILALMLARFAVRIGSRRPPPVLTGHALFDRLAPLVHYALYAVVLLMAASGIALALQAGLPGILFGGSGSPLPDSFSQFRPRGVHGLLAWLLAALVALHIAGALFHQLVRRDRLLSRMAFKKGSGPFFAAEDSRP